MATLRLDISPTPAHVRTARLVATTVARQCGVEEGALDEIRLAVGEACSRAVNLHRELAPHALVTIWLADDQRFTVTVVDDAPVGADVSDVDPIDLIEGTTGPDGGLDSLPSGFGLAVIDGLVDDLHIEPVADGGNGTRVTMSWPLV